MKDTPIKILDHIYYRDEASLKSNKFRIASSGSESMIKEKYLQNRLYVKKMKKNRRTRDEIFCTWKIG